MSDTPARGSRIVEGDDAPGAKRLVKVVPPKDPPADEPEPTDDQEPTDG